MQLARTGKLIFLASGLLCFCGTVGSSSAAPVLTLINPLTVITASPTAQSVILRGSVYNPETYAIKVDGVGLDETIFDSAGDELTAAFASGTETVPALSSLTIPLAVISIPAQAPPGLYDADPAGSDFQTGILVFGGINNGGDASNVCTFSVEIVVPEPYLAPLTLLLGMVFICRRPRSKSESDCTGELTPSTLQL